MTGLEHRLRVAQGRTRGGQKRQERREQVIRQGKPKMGVIVAEREGFRNNMVHTTR